MTTAITLSRQNDVGSRAHHLVLRKTRRRSRSRISKGVFSQLNRKWSLPPFNMPWHYPICITKLLYSYRDDWPETLGKTTAQVGKKSISGRRASVKKSICFSSLSKGLDFLYQILLYMGSIEDNFKFFTEAFTGGCLGELTQWSDLMSALYILGHDLIITSDYSDLRK